MERTTKKPENLPDNKPNSDEKPFFNRKGIPPTMVSIAGTIGSIVGIRNIDKHWGAIMLATSSFGDLLDGKMARGEIDIEKIISKFIGKNEDSSDNPGSENKETGETILGTLADHIGDKIKIAAILYELHRRDAAPNLVLGGIAVSNAFNAGMTAINTVRHPGESRPVKAGKIGMACQVVSVVSYAIGDFLEAREKTTAGELLRKLGTAAFTAGVPFMIKAGIEYAEEASKK